jgi:hypothetical protein
VAYPGDSLEENLRDIFEWNGDEGKGEKVG